MGQVSNGSTNQDGSHGSGVIRMTHRPMIRMYPETDEAISIFYCGEEEGGGVKRANYVMW